MSGKTSVTIDVLLTLNSSKGERNAQFNGAPRAHRAGEPGVKVMGSVANPRTFTE